MEKKNITNLILMKIDNQDDKLFFDDLSTVRRIIEAKNSSCYVSAKKKIAS